MTYDPLDHPLHGVGLEAVLSSVVRHYGWPILAEQIPINCFKSYPTFASALKFLKKTQWARERLEAFYLYRYKQCDLPSDEEHELAPRNRHVQLPDPELEPAVIEEGDAEFFDDPASGPKFPSRKEVQASQSASRSAQQRSAQQADAKLASKMAEAPIKTSEVKRSSQKSGPNKSGKTAESGKTAKSEKTTSGKAADPWAKWRGSDD